MDDNSFDLVVSLDTIEQMPRSQRIDFLRGFYRVARKGVIVCAPLGTPEHAAHERKILEPGMFFGESLAYLAEHVKYGLPEPKEVCEMANILSARTYFQGDFWELEIARSEKKAQGYLGLFSSSLRNLKTDMRFRVDKHLTLSCTPYTNRFFLVVRKGNDRQAAA